MEKNLDITEKDTREPLPTDKIKDYWENFGSVYSKNTESYTFLTGKTEFEKCLSYIGKPDNLNLYELASGSGYLAEFIVKNYISRFNELRFVDLSHFMVEKTKERLKPYIEKKDSHIVVEERSCEDFNNIQNEYYDIILGNLVIHIVENPDNVFSGIKKSLKNDGHLFLSYLDSLKNSNFFLKYQEILNKYNLSNQNSRSIFYFAQENMIETFAKKYGFRIIEESSYNIVLNKEGNDVFQMYYDMIITNKFEDKIDATAYKKFIEDVKNMVEQCNKEGIDLNTRIINKHLVKEK